MKRLIPRAAFILVAVLVIAGILLTLGQREGYTNPIASSYNPSGLHAFQELLGQNGIPSLVTRNNAPRLRKSDLVIATYVQSDTDVSAIETNLKAFVESGGRVLVLPFDNDFRARSKTAYQYPTQIVSNATGDTLKVHSSPLDYNNMLAFDGQVSGGGSFLSLNYNSISFVPWSKSARNSNAPMLVIESRGEGLLARASDGLFATNRFIDKEDNAQFALSVVRSMLPPEGRVVFAEAALGNGEEPTLASILGPWAVGAWNQFLVLCGVIVLTLGIRFGLPEVERRKQRGQRELIDAVADVYLRAKATSAALDSAYEDADRRIRRALKLPTHATFQQRDERLPESLAQNMQHLDQLRKPLVLTDSKGRQRVVNRLQPTEALEFLRKLEDELASFIPGSKNRIS